MRQMKFISTFIAGSILLLAIFFSACSDDHKQEEEPKEDLTNTVPGRLEIPRLTEIRLRINLLTIR